MDSARRRQFLRATGAAAVVALAGCTTNGGGGDGNGSGGGNDTGGRDGNDSAGGNDTAGRNNGGGPGNGLASDDYPAVDRWLKESEAGAADDTYEGTIEDMRDQDTVTVEVGAPGNGGNFAFAPAAAVVSTGTTVEWSWTGEGNPHNVEAQPAEQIGESAYEFSSGDPVGGTGVQYTQTLDQPGVALYHCEPHLSLGMKGGIAVE